MSRELKKMKPRIAPDSTEQRLRAIAIVMALCMLLVIGIVVVMGTGKGKKGGGGSAIIIALLLALIGYLISSLLRFALSRKREYLADAGSAELTHRPLALASALRKISDDPTIEAVKRKDIAQMFIENPQVRPGKSTVSLSTLFATHPPISKRIQLLEQF